MKIRTYKNHKNTYKSYIKPIGKGFEVGFFSGGKTLFVGNFVHLWEANHWYSIMNREIKTFSKKFKVGKTFPATFFNNFIGHHLYERYYRFVNTCINTHTRLYKKQTNTFTKKYYRIKKQWTGGTQKPFLKVA